MTLGRVQHKFGPVHSREIVIVEEIHLGFEGCGRSHIVVEESQIMAVPPLAPESGPLPNPSTAHRCEERPSSLVPFLDRQIAQGSN